MVLDEIVVSHGTLHKDIRRRSVHSYFLVFRARISLNLTKTKNRLVDGQQLLATASEDASIRVWNVAASSCTCIKELRSNESLKKQSKEEEMLRCSWSSNKPGLLAGGNSLGNVILWDTTKADAKDRVVGEWKSKSKTSPAERT